MTVVESANRSCAWTTTAYRAPRWTCPRRRGTVISYTSPRSTEILHQGSHLVRLTDEAWVFHKPPRPVGGAASPALPLGCLGDSLPCGLCTATRNLVELAEPLITEPQR